MNRIFLVPAFLFILSSCNKQATGPQPKCGADTAFASNETIEKINVNYIGNTLGACAGAEIPIIVYGTYSQHMCGSRYGLYYTTNPVDINYRRLGPYECGTKSYCENYNTLDCSGLNFIFTVQDETTGATVGEVTPSCNLKLFNNVGQRTVVKARSTNNSAFYPEAGVINPGNILTCH